jgi:hypothetical protein
MQFDTLDEYLSFIDTRAPDSLKHHEQINGIKLEVDPYVWNPNKGKSSKMFIQLLKDYDLEDVNNALDIGSGSGVLSLVLWKRKIRNLVAVDNMQEAINNSEHNFALNNAEIEIKYSDLFSEVTGLYDLILFNAPATHPKRRNIDYTMQSLWSPEENVRMRFLEGLQEHLSVNGRALLMYSRFPDYDPIPEMKLKDFPFSYNYLVKDNSSLSESGIIEIRRTGKD